MKKMLILPVLLLITAGPVFGQIDDDDWWGNDSADRSWWESDSTWIEQNNINDFQEKANKKFNDFRDSANARFARELGKPWRPVKLERPIERPRMPKPDTPPVAPRPQEGRTPAPEKLPWSTVAPIPDIKIKPREFPPLEYPNDMLKTKVNFYHLNIMLDLPKEQNLSQCTLASENEEDVKQMWEAMYAANVQSCSRRIQNEQAKHHVNDWGLFDITTRLVAKMFPDDHNRRVVATVFLLNQMEYNAKIARTNRGLVCLLPTNCMIYSEYYVVIDSTRYFLFMPDDAQNEYDDIVIYTHYNLMEGAKLSISMSMDTMPELPIKKVGKPFRSIVAGNMAEVCVNENLMNFYREYPQVDREVYANAGGDSLFRDAVDKWFRPMVQGKSTYYAVYTLLDYLQHCFVYAKDDEQFGFEKQFFCEENFYYPKNDCEDRAVLFSYLVRYLLGLDVVLLEYYDHVSTAVHFPEGNVIGDYFEVEGKRYVACDPTYEGANIGMSQPAYKDVEAKIIMLKPIVVDSE